MLNHWHLTNLRRERGSYKTHTFHSPCQSLHAILLKMIVIQKTHLDIPVLHEIKPLEVHLLYQLGMPLKLLKKRCVTTWTIIGIIWGVQWMVLMQRLLLIRHIFLQIVSLPSPSHLWRVWIWRGVSFLMLVRSQNFQLRQEGHFSHPYIRPTLQKSLCFRPWCMFLPCARKELLC